MRKRLVLVALVLFSVTSRAQTSVPADGSFTTSDGIKIHYLTLGSSGSWVVLIHGYTDNARHMWFTTGIAPVLAKNHRVVALDNRNHGQSDKPVAIGAPTTPQYADAMKRFIDAYDEIAQ